jgi:hypothetical protein
MYPRVQLIMLPCQISDIWINFAAVCGISLSQTGLLLMADTRKLTIVASLQFQLHPCQSLLFDYFVIWDLLQNGFLIQVMLQIIVVVMNFIYTSIRLSCFFAARGYMERRPYYRYVVEDIFDLVWGYVGG